MATILFNRLIVICAIYQILAIDYLAMAGTCSAQNVSAFFVFGDSLVAVGNNFYRKTIAKPRFPNEEELGFENFAPPYLDSNAVGDVVLKDVNYTFAGSGIFNSSELIFAKRIGAPAARRLLRQALQFVVMGSNDIIMRKLSLSNGVNYLDNLISKFRSQLTGSISSTYSTGIRCSVLPFIPIEPISNSVLLMLDNLDARKIAVTNAPILGCIPFERDPNPSDACVASINEQAKLYNVKLKSMLQELTANLARSTFVYLDACVILEDILENYKSNGFENADSACCQMPGRRFLSCLCRENQNMYSGINSIQHNLLI
ncbi:hypothetical protein QUC31_012563 [Theobroma cacao]